MDWFGELALLLQDMLLGGRETSSTALDPAITELLRNPRVMKKAQAEVFCIAVNVGETDPEQSIYLKLVVKETLRLRHPPLPLLTSKRK